MRWLARLLSSRRAAWAVVALSLIVTAAGAAFALRVEHDDDLLAFLPEGNRDVAGFYEINERFGSLDVAIVGVETKDPFDPEFFRRLQEATKALNEEKSVHYALSLANVQDFAPSEAGGIETDFLVPSIPSDPEQKSDLIDRVMSRDLVVGQLISKQKHAVLIYCFQSFGSDPKIFAGKVKEIVGAGFPDESLYWGGAPFISTYIYSATQDDLQKLTPWAVAVIILLIVLSFRDPVGAVLALVSTGMGIAVTVGAMGLLGVDYNLVLSSMPVILFSVGSAYAIHVLARFYQVGDLEKTLVGVGPTVIAAGLTTVAGLLSFGAMDIAPMRTFGLFTAFGIGVTLLLSLTFVPAVIRLLGLGGKQLGRSAITSALVPVVDFARSRPRLVGGILVAFAVLGGRFALSVDNRMDQTAFFTEGSPPDLADRFLLEHFGGATFIQVQVEGDFTRPEVLRELGRVADRIESIEAVSNVQHVGQVVAQINAAMEGARRIPDEAAKVKVLYRLLTGNAAVGQLVTPDRKSALLVVKVRSNDVAEIQQTLAAVERIIGEELVRGYRLAPVAEAEAAARQRLYALGRIRVLLSRAGITPTRRQIESIRVGLETPLAPVLSPVVKPDVIRFLGSEECLVDLENDERRERLGAALVELGPAPSDEALARTIRSTLDGETIEGAVLDDVLVGDLVASLRTPLREIWRRHNALDYGRRLLAEAKLEPPERTVRRIADMLLVLDAPTALVPSGTAAADGRLAATVNGLPVLHRGMSVSATRNQIISLVLALLMVAVLLSVTFKSVRYGLLASSPTILTLLVIYGGMGWLGVHLDIGTSMLASIIIGAGVDYAVHLVAAWRDAHSAHAAVEKTGPAIWTNALMVAAGFFVLTLGEARPLQNVGGLTAAAMLTAAVSTFLAIPVLGGRLLGGRTAEADAIPVPEDSPKGATP